MRNPKNVSTALKLVSEARAMKKPAKFHIPHTSRYSSVRMRLRNEAQLLKAMGRGFLIAAVIGEALLCAFHGVLYSAYANTYSDGVAVADPTSMSVVATVMIIAGILFAATCISCALVMFGVSESLRREVKRIR